MTLHSISSIRTKTGWQVLDISQPLVSITLPEVEFDTGDILFTICAHLGLDIDDLFCYYKEDRFVIEKMDDGCPLYFLM